MVFVFSVMFIYSKFSKTSIVLKFKIRKGNDISNRYGGACMAKSVAWQRHRTRKGWVYSWVRLATPQKSLKLGLDATDPVQKWRGETKKGRKAILMCSTVRYQCGQLELKSIGDFWGIHPKEKTAGEFNHQPSLSLVDGFTAMYSSCKLSYT